MPIRVKYRHASDPTFSNVINTVELPSHDTIQEEIFTYEAVKDVLGDRLRMMGVAGEWLGDIVITEVEFR